MAELVILVHLVVNTIQRATPARTRVHWSGEKLLHKYRFIPKTDWREKTSRQKPHDDKQG